MRAREAGQTVKVVGAGHSFTATALTDGVMMDVSKLQGVIEADRASGLVKVGAGSFLYDLNQDLYDLGLAMPNLGDIDHQTIAGAISTATHGTGIGLQNISAAIVGVEIVDGEGVLREITTDGDDLRAARVNVGALGALTSLTLQTVPAFKLHRQDVPMPLDEVLDGLATQLAANDHFEFFVFPYTSTALTVLRNRTDGPTNPRSAFDEKFNEDFIQNTLGDLLLKLARKQPKIIPTVAKMATRLLSEGEYTDWSHKVFASSRDIRFTEMEYAVPLEHGPAFCRRVLALIEEQNLPIAMPIECRMVAGDDALLSPVHGRDSFYLAVHMYTGMDWRPYFRAVEAIAGEYDGRPHWGKRHELDAATLRERYPRFDDFLAIRDAFDPDRRFANDYTRSVFGE